MNFYRHYLGDYGRKTAHLSLVEHGAYRVLLDHYYALGKSLPADLDALCRICRAQTEPERKAVKSVADQFFSVNGDGTRHNKRADEELNDYHTQAETNRRIAVAREVKRKEHERSTKRSTNEARTLNLSQKLEVRSQKLEARSQKPEAVSQKPEKKEKAEARATRLPSAWTLPDDWQAWAMQEREWTEAQTQAVAEAFRDYWIAVAGSRGCKLDWGATWRNWVRKEYSQRANGASKNQQAAAEAKRRILGEERTHEAE